MIIKKNSKFALIGHGFALYHLYVELKKNGFKEPIIITHEKKYHLRDIKENKDDKKLYRNIDLFKFFDNVTILKYQQN